MHRKTSWILLVVLLAGLAPALWAESHEEGEKEAPAAPAPTFMYVWTDHVSVANAAAYEAAVKEVTDKIAATEEGKKLQYFALSGQGGYSYVIPMGELAEFSQKNQDFMAATNAVGGMQVWDASNKLVDHGSGALIVSRPDLSYAPAAPREAEKSGLFRLHEWWYIRPGHEMEIEEVARKVAALYAEKEADTGFRIYQAVTGEDLPLYLVSVAAVDAADYHNNDTRLNELLGEAGQKLIQEAMGLARRVERTSAMIRPDLSMGM